MKISFGGSIRLGPGLGPAVVAFDLWIATLSSPQMPRSSGPKLGAGELIASVAEAVAGEARGLERDLLTKSVAETLFIAAGQNVAVSARTARNRWSRYIRAHGTRALIEMFLANHLWNVLWFKAGDVFGKSGDRVTEYTMRRLQRTCSALVTTACQSWELNDSVTLSVAQRVVGAIEASVSPS